MATITQETRIVRIVVDGRGAQTGGRQAEAALRGVDVAARRVARSVDDASRRMIEGMSRANIASDILVAGMSRAGAAAAQMSAGAAGMGRSVGLASYQVLQLGQQFQDLAIQVASGQNPILALAQQGSQAAFIMGGFGASIAAVRDGVRSLTAVMMRNPLFAGGAAAAAIAAAAGAYLLLRDNTEETTEAQQRYNDSLELANKLIEDADRKAQNLAENQERTLRTSVAQAEAEISRLEREIEQRRAFVEDLLRGPGGMGTGPFGTEEQLQQAIGQETQLVELQDEMNRQLDERKTLLEALRILERDRQETIADTIEDLERENEQLQALRFAHLQGAAAVNDVNDAIAVDNQLRKLGVDIKSEEGQRIAELIVANRELERTIDHISEAERTAAKTTQETAVKADDLKDAFTDAGQAIGTAFEDAIIRGETLGGVLRGLEQDIIRIATRVAITNPLERALTGFIDGIDFGSFFGGGGGTPAPTGGTPMPGQIPGRLHSGGIVGRDGSRGLPVPASLFAGAPRFHNGGLVPGEVPIIARVGEEVLTPSDPRHSRNGGGGNVTVQIIDQRSAGGDIRTRETRGPNGERTIQAFVLDAVDQGLSSGRFDRTLGRTFGVTRRGATR